MLALAPIAAADAMTAEEFNTALAASVGASGLFATGTTLAVQAHDYESGDALAMTVNPDGSVAWFETSPETGAYNLRCVRVDRCWELSRRAYGNVRWHRLPAGAVTYRQASAFWAEWIGTEWPTDATFAEATAPDGSQTFTVTAPSGSDVVTVGVSVSGPGLVFSIRSASGASPPEDIVSLTMRAGADRVVVPPPAPSTVGAPSTVRSRWQAVINS